MSVRATAEPRPALAASLAHSDRAIFVPLTLAHAVALLAIPSIPLIAIAMWWNANTIAHNFIHRPFFRSVRANRAFSACLSLVLGVPQELWRQRHLRHHAEAAHGTARPLSLSAALVGEGALVVAGWIALMFFAPRFFVSVYLPGWGTGLVLCQMQGHFEHARGTTSHYGWLYNRLFFNDGYHVEHHRRPSAPWRELPSLGRSGTPSSRWPAVLRWLDTFSLDGLERVVARMELLRRFVVRVHERAFRRLLPEIGPAQRITVVGGGLFPRTALVLARVAPDAAVTIVDLSADHLEAARPFLAARAGADVPSYVFTQEKFDPASPCDTDLVILPLAFDGDRVGAYAHPPARTMLVHDWIWAPHGRSVVISWLLLKRLNLVRA